MVVYFIFAHDADSISVFSDAPGSICFLRNNLSVYL
jgi:hypothetical protein